jgi:uncharacterized membrane protein
MNKLKNKILKLFEGLGKKVISVVYLFFGSWTAIFLHTVWFVIWEWMNLDFLLLTTILSVEAVLIAIFILMAQKMEEDEKEIERKVDSKNISDVKKMLKSILEQQSESNEILEEISENIEEIEEDIDDIEESMDSRKK